MNVLQTIKNYCCYCGIGKDEYNAVKKDAYISNFKVWKILSFLMIAVFGALFASSLFSNMLSTNRTFYLIALLYSLVSTAFFFILKKDSLAAQLLIYLSMSFLFLFGCFITQNKPDTPATTFIVLLLITPMFMLDKPYFMAIELCIASAVFLVWMYFVKDPTIWHYDLANVVIFTVVGIILHIVASSIRIKEFVLTRELGIQKDTDDLTGLKNKGAVTRGINKFLTDKADRKGLMFLMDIDAFKSINDTYGHDVGDLIIKEFGDFLKREFATDELVARWGGDEFIVFIRRTDDVDTACEIAQDIVEHARKEVVIPGTQQGVEVSVGIAIYEGDEENYSELFKKADIAMYKAKADPNSNFCVYTDE